MTKFAVGLPHRAFTLSVHIWFFVPKLNSRYQIYITHHRSSNLAGSESRSLDWSLKCGQEQMLRNLPTFSDDLSVPEASMFLISLHV